MSFGSIVRTPLCTIKSYINGHSLTLTMISYDTPPRRGYGKPVTNRIYDVIHTDQDGDETHECFYNLKLKAEALKHFKRLTTEYFTPIAQPDGEA